MVVRACEEEIFFGIGNRAGDERDDTGVSYMEGCINCEGIGGVALETSY